MAGLDQLRDQLTAAGAPGPRGPGAAGSTRTLTVHRALRVLLGLLPPLVAACGGTPAAGAQTGTAVDSVIPREEALARFRDGLTPPARLAGGASSMRALVARFVRALEAADTAALRGLVLTREEFAFLYYPTHPEGLPPYDLRPGLMWELLVLRSGRGLYHLLERRAGRPLGYRSFRCDPGVSVQGVNRVRGPCRIRRTEGGRVVEERLFGLVLEREGRFKFVSYANALD